jgi:cold shock CspA family protein
MDVYRPYPAQQPADHDEEEALTEPARRPATPEGPLPATVVAGPSTDAEVPPRAAQPRQERPLPDLEHPGGHLHGVVARLNRPRRFGFLRADDGVEVFFHASALSTGPGSFDRLRPGQEVEFDCHQDEQGRGLAASLVTIIGELPEPQRPQKQRQAERARAARAQATGWHVEVLQDRQGETVQAQLERLLNERGIKPGNFTFNLTETDEGVECWVAYYVGS